MAQTSNLLGQHPPAVKVGGRRLSISTKHKSHPAPEPASAATEAPPTEKETEIETDYPRPAAPGEEEAVHHIHHEEEVPPKKNKKHENYEDDKRQMEAEQRKAEMNRPTREGLQKSGGKGFGGAGRIAQPAKGMQV